MHRSTVALCPQYSISIFVGPSRHSACRKFNTATHELPHEKEIASHSPWKIQNFEMKWPSFPAPLRSNRIITNTPNHNNKSTSNGTSQRPRASCSEMMWRRKNDCSNLKRIWQRSMWRITWMINAIFLWCVCRHRAPRHSAAGHSTITKYFECAAWNYVFASQRNRRDDM